MLYLRKLPSVLVFFSTIWLFLLFLLTSESHSSSQSQLIPNSRMPTWGTKPQSKIYNSENVSQFHQLATGLKTLVDRHVGIDPGGSNSQILVVSSGSNLILRVAVPPEQKATVALKDPNSQVVLPTKSDLSELGTLYLYKISSPAAGKWTLEVQSETARSYYLLAEQKISNVALESFVPKSEYFKSDRVEILVRLLRNGKLIPANKLNGTLALPNGSKKKLKFIDDGSHESAIAGDHIYSASFLAKEVGEYLYSVSAQGDDYQVQYDNKVVVLDSKSELTRNYTMTTVDKDRDSFFETLVFSIEAKLRSKGKYRLVGSLEDSNGVFIDQTQVVISVTKIGVKQIDLNFSGSRIKKLASKGVLKVKDLILEKLIDGKYQSVSIDLTPHITNRIYAPGSFE